MDLTLPPPTDEQITLIDLILTGGSTAAEALAGTGKTTLLRGVSARLMQQPRPRTLTYLAYNRAMADEAKQPGVFAPNTSVSTTHALARRATDYALARRLSQPRQTSQDVARQLGLGPIVTPALGGSTRLAPGFLGGHVMGAVRRFTESADDEIGVQHFAPVQGLDALDHEGRPTFGPNSKYLAESMLDHAQAAWRDLCSTTGKLPFSHDCYLKQYALTRPRLLTDVVMLDEAQDTNPCVFGLVEAQREHAQVVYVGDRFQMIYAWRGAMNAMAEAKVEHRGWLTHSFRFGPQIAAEANLALDALGCERHVVGAGRDGTVGPIANPTAVLTRTNAGALKALMRLLGEGKAVALVADVVRSLIPFFEAAQRLQEGQRVGHPDLAAFGSWGEVQQFVEVDPLGSDLAMLVTLCDDYSPRELIKLMNRCADQSFCDVTVSTAHKSKGRQWDHVQLGPDFPDPITPDPMTGKRRKLTAEDKRLLYVAATRARTSLDVTHVRAFDLFHNPALGAS